MKPEENKQLETEQAEEICTEATKEAAAKKVQKVTLFKNKKFRMGTTATVFTAVFVAAVVLLNVIVGILNDRYPISIDLTGDGLYTMSENSQKVAASIKTPVEIVIFGTEDSYKNSTNVVLKQLHEFTKQYETLTKGLVTVSYVDATQDPQTFAKYSSYNVSDGSVLFLAKDAKDDTALRSAVAQTEDLFEYDQEAYYYYGEFSLTASLVEKTLASNLQIVTRENATGVTLLTGHDENTYTISAVKDVLTKNGYSSCTELDFTTTAEFDENASVAVICAPAKDFTANEIKRLAEWLDNDGARERNLVVFTSPTAACPNLYEYLAEEHGIQVEDYLLAESDQNNMFPVNFGYGSQYNNFAAFATVEDTDIGADLYAENARVQLFQTRAVTPLWGTDSEQSFSFNTVLASLNADTAMMMSVADINAAEEDESLSPSLEEAEASSAVVLSTDTVYDNNTNKAMDTFVLAIGAAEYFSLGYENNETLFMNAFNAMNDNADMISVSSVSLTPETLEVSAGTATVLGIGVFTVGLPLLMIILGVVVFIRRKHL